MISATLIPTIMIEGLALWIWQRAAEKRGEQFPYLPLLVVLSAVNMMTQILLYVALSVPGGQYWRTLFLTESVIVGIEAIALMIARLPLRYAVRVSLMVNLVSFLAGLLIPV